MTNSDKAVEILQKTNDGRDLYGDGWQLALVENAVNYRLSEKGQTIFDALHRQVMTGDYKYPLDEFFGKFCS